MGLKWCVYVLHQSWNAYDRLGWQPQTSRTPAFPSLSTHIRSHLLEPMSPIQIFIRDIDEFSSGHELWITFGEIFESMIGSGIAALFSRVDCER
jgi:hypothetical protein